MVTVAANLFYLLLLLLPLNFRHIFNYELVKGVEGFREHLTWSVYGFDIVLGMLLFVVGISSLRTTVFRYSLQDKRTLIWPAVVLSVASLSVILSDHKTVTLYNSARLLAAITAFLIAKELCRSEQVRTRAISILFWGGIIQSILAAGQFLLQRSVGLTAVGESLIGPSILGVAKIELHGEKFIRAYGTFPHPNVLGAFLLCSLVCGIWLLYRMKHQRGHRDPLSPVFGIAVVLMGIFLTFSRSVWLAAALLLLMNLTRLPFPGTSFKAFLRRPAYVLPAILFLILSGALLVTFLPSRMCVTQCPNDASYQLRKEYNLSAINLIFHHPSLGIGLGNFVPHLDDHSSSIALADSATSHTSLRPWERQPAHNLYLLIASEIGILGLLFLFVFIYESIGQRLSLRHDLFAQLFLAFLLLGFFDHYFWTLAQGQFLFWLLLALLRTSVSTKSTPQVVVSSP